MMTETRRYWVDTLLRIATPVLSALADGKLKETMQWRKKFPGRRLPIWKRWDGR